MLIDREIGRSISNPQWSNALRLAKTTRYVRSRLHRDRANRDDRPGRSDQEGVSPWGMRGGRSTRDVSYRGCAIESSTGSWAESGWCQRLEMAVQHQDSLILTRNDVTGADGKP